MLLKLAEVVLDVLLLLLLGLLLEELVRGLLALELPHIMLDLILDKLGEARIDIELADHLVGHSFGSILEDIEVKARRASLRIARHGILNRDIDHVPGALLPLRADYLFFSSYNCYRIHLLTLSRRGRGSFWIMPVEDGIGGA